MMQISLFYEDINDATRACVQALGGAKVVGSSIWPSKLPQKAGEHLLNSLNPNHAQKLSLDETVMIFKMAREIGFHDGMNYFAEFCGYRAPDPVTKEEQKAEIQQELLTKTEELTKLYKRLETIGIMQ